MNLGEIPNVRVFRVPGCVYFIEKYLLEGICMLLLWVLGTQREVYATGDRARMEIRGQRMTLSEGRMMICQEYLKGRIYVREIRMEWEIKAWEWEGGREIKNGGLCKVCALVLNAPLSLRTSLFPFTPPVITAMRFSTLAALALLPVSALGMFASRLITISE